MIDKSRRLSDSLDPGKLRGCNLDDDRAERQSVYLETVSVWYVTIMCCGVRDDGTGSRRAGSPSCLILCEGRFEMVSAVGAVPRTCGAVGRA